jgi:hypothetical protein
MEREVWLPCYRFLVSALRTGCALLPRNIIFLRPEPDALGTLKEIIHRVCNERKWHGWVGVHQESGAWQTRLVFFKGPVEISLTFI